MFGWTKMKVFVVSAVWIAILSTLIKNCSAVHCYKCESYRDYRCLDPFDYRPHVRVNCDFEPYVRDRKPVFCEKTTELIDGVYVTTRGCSTYQWEDVDSYLDHRNQNMRCFRRGRLERCLCPSDGCNGADKNGLAYSVTAVTALSVFLAFSRIFEKIFG